MADAYINELEINGQKRLDLTQDTATPETVLEGETFHLRSGAPATGTYRPSDEIEARLRATVGHNSTNYVILDAKSQTINGINYTVDNSAGTVTANGTAINSNTMYHQYIPIAAVDRKVVVTGCPKNSSSSLQWYMIVWDETVTARCKVWDGTATHPDMSNQASTSDKIECILPANHNCRISFRVFNGVTVSNLIFKPMMYDWNKIPTDERIVDLEARVAALEAIINNR